MTRSSSSIMCSSSSSSSSSSSAFVVVVLLFAITVFTTVDAFQRSPTFHYHGKTTSSGGGGSGGTQELFPNRLLVPTLTSLHDTASSDESSNDDSNDNEVSTYLQSNYPTFYSLLASKNDEIMSCLRTTTSSSTTTGYTFFVPPESYFVSLDDKKMVQLKDERNDETIAKMAGYHFVPTEALTDVQLQTEDWTVQPKTVGEPRPLTIGGIVTLSGELRVGRSKSGGYLFGLLGAKEDGGIVVGNDAKIIKSTSVGNNCIVHEVDCLVSPELLWRYFDQLRIPGF